MALHCGRLVVWLRIRHQQAVGRDEFLSRGLIALVYGTAELCYASGFLAVYAAGLALQRVKQKPHKIQTPLDIMLIPQAALTIAAGAQISQVAPVARVAEVASISAAMTDAVQEFNEQLEKLAEMAIVLLVGAMLPYTTPTMSVCWFVPMLFLVIRLIAVAIGTVGEKTAHHECATISWFDIRGIGSVFYLLFAIGRGVMGAESAIDHHHAAHRRCVNRRAWRVSQTIDEVVQAAQVPGGMTCTNGQTGRSIRVRGS